MNELTQRKGTLFACVLFGLVLVALIWVPAQFGHNTRVISAAATEHYNNRVAHIVTVLWVVLTVAGVYALSSAAITPGPATPETGPATGLGRFLLPVLTILGIALIYFPPALAWRGPYMEESIHLSAIHRMLAGDLPYRDFEFLYGPLMLYPAYWWVKLTGFTLTGFYTYVMVLEMVVLLAILAPIQTYLRGFWARLAAYLLLASLYFNAMLGPNQNGLRKAAGVLLLISVARRPYQRGLWPVHGTILGLLLAYSQDFGAATAIGIAAIYAALFAKRRERAALAGLATIAATSAVVWLGTLWLLLGPAFADYFITLRYLTAQFDAGEAAFRFYWTASGLAVFGLVAVAAWLTGRVLARRWDTAPATGDLLIIGGLAYAAVMLKSGLSRADQWHLVPGVLVIVLALVLPIAGRIAPIPRPARMLGIVLTLVLAATYTFGQFRIIRYVFREGLLSGYAGLAAGDHEHRIPGTPLARPATEFQRAHPDRDVTALAEFLATPPALDKRIFIYGGSWSLPYRVGATKAGYLADDYIYGDTRGDEARAFLDANPQVLVVMGRDTYDWLKLGPDAEVPEPGLNLVGYGRMRTLRAQLTSVHIPGVYIEEKQKAARWRRLIGVHVMESYAPVYLNDKFVVLERKTAN